MGILMMGFQGGDQQSYKQQSTSHSSWYNLTLDELGNRLRSLGKQLGNLRLEELLNSNLVTETQQSLGLRGEGNSSYLPSMQQQAGLTVARALQGKTVDEIWRDIQRGKKKITGQEMKHENEATFGELTVEDFLLKAGIFVQANFGQTTGLDVVGNSATQDYVKQLASSPSPSVDTMSDTPTPSGKRGAVEPLDKSIERRLRRKIKNRESAARSRARKQAYYNELMTKVSILEEKNMSLKRDKQLDEMLPYDLHTGTKYQLRRTSSASL